MKKILNAAMQYGDWDDNFIKFPNGLIIQWGTSASSNSSNGVTVTFPVKHVRTPFVMTQTLWNSVWNYGATIYDERTNEFKWRAWNGVNGAALTTAATIRWVSIGFYKNI